MHTNINVNDFSLNTLQYVEKSYKRHKQLFRVGGKDDIENERMATWLNESTADAWRHQRGHEIIEGLQRQSSWLTVGDGRWGMDAIRIKRKGFSEVMPSDISTDLLKKSKARGYIDEFLPLNAERMELPTESYDYVFCKEALHHFPRPYVALYEMIRVARKGVVLTEPKDAELGTIRIAYEPVGNFVFLLSVRELVKLSMAMNLAAICWHGYNDYYIDGCEFEPADEEKSDVFREIKRQIAKMDQAVMEGKKDYNKISVILFKQVPFMEEKTRLQAMGNHFIELPHNPYLTEWTEKDEDYYIYGTGQKGEALKNYFSHQGINVLGFIDSYASKWGQKFMGKQIFSPQEACEKLKVHQRIAIASAAYQEIERVLFAQGVSKKNILVTPFSYDAIHLK